MEYTDMFRQLLETEAAARTMQKEAQAFKAGMAADLQKLVESHRKRVYEKADAQIARVEQEAVTRADRQIARLDEDARQHFNRLREIEFQNRGRWIRQIFFAAICRE